MSSSFFVKRALLEAGWADNVLISISSKGVIESILSNTEVIKGTESVDGCLIPGMPNLHSHAFQRAFAGLTECRGGTSDSFWTWRKIMYQFVDKISPTQAFIIARQLYIEMLKTGFTAVAEFHYLHHDSTGNKYNDPAEMSHSVINAALATGIAITHLPVYYRYSGFNDQDSTEGQRRFVHQPDEYQQLLDALFGYYRSDPRIRIGIAPHSLRAVNGSDINAASSMLDAYDPEAPIHIHIAEQIAEVRECKAHTGQRPVQHLFEQCDVNERWCLIHATHINDQEAWEMAESGAVAGLCLSTEANLGDGFFPAPLYLDREGCFGIGSDSQISISPLDELRLLEYGQRLVQQKRAVLCNSETPSVGRFLYQRAAMGGARALGRKTAKIAVGYQADWLVLDEDNPALFSKKEDQILDSIIFSSTINPIKDVMVGGEWVVKDGHHILEAESSVAFRKVMAELIV